MVVCFANDCYLEDGCDLSKRKMEKFDTDVTSLQLSLYPAVHNPHLLFQIFFSRCFLLVLLLFDHVAFTCVACCENFTRLLLRCPWQRFSCMRVSERRFQDCSGGVVWICARLPLFRESRINSPGKSRGFVLLVRLFYPTRGRVPFFEGGVRGKRSPLFPVLRCVEKIAAGKSRRIYSIGEVATVCTCAYVVGRFSVVFFS